MQTKKYIKKKYYSINNKNDFKYVNLRIYMNLLNPYKSYESSESLSDSPLVFINLDFLDFLFIYLDFLDEPSLLIFSLESVFFVLLDFLAISNKFFKIVHVFEILL